MSEPYSLSVEDHPDPEEVKQVHRGLEAYNIAHAGDTNYRPLTIFVRDANRRIVGGLLGNTYWGWLYIAILWIREDLRQQGYGRRLMAMAEDEAVRRGCRYAQVDTMDFQAPAFYEKQGYTVWGVIDDMPAGTGHKRYFFRKELQPS